MTCRKTKRHLEFDSLEAMELFSGAWVTAAHPGIPNHVAQVHRGTNGAVSDAAVNLAGTLQGPYRSAGGGSTVEFTGRGTVTPIGKAQLQGKIAYSASPSTGKMTLQVGKSGKVFAAIAGQTSRGVYSYQITGGTRTFAGDTGVGLAIVDILSANRAQTRGRFAPSLQPEVLS